MSRLLLVEDDLSLGATLQERLRKEGYAVDWAQDKQTAESHIAGNDYQLILLDVGLPDGTGFEFARQVRQQHAVPFIFVTAMADAEYRLQGYELGAEEFIPKPFHLKELLLRVARVLQSNHNSPASSGDIALGSHRFDPGQMCIIGPDGHRQFLAKRDCDVLTLLIERAPAVVSRDAILDSAWSADSFPSNRSVDNCIVRLRQLLGDRNGEKIRTVRGVGYQLVND